MPQDGLLDRHQVLPCENHSAGQAGADPGDTGERGCHQVLVEVPLKSDGFMRSSANLHQTISFNQVVMIRSAGLDSLSREHQEYFLEIFLEKSIEIHVMTA